MDAFKYAIFMACVTVLFCSGCATSPEVESQQKAKQADIAEILSQPLDPAEFGETKRCLSEMEFHSFRALDDKHILFNGRRNKQWINTLPWPCPDLRFGNVLQLRSFSGSRMCEMDKFLVADWFDYPWYRRWPWHWGGSWGTGPHCSLGKFQPVTKEQLAEIEAILKSR